jgi:chorismate synthase
MPLRFLTAGESHGPALTAILEGLPAGLSIDESVVNDDLKRRQKGEGSGPRMKLEDDRVRFLGGVMAGITTGAPLAMQIMNRDHERWVGKPIQPFTIPRPGHVDLAAAVKYGYHDLRPGLERASARETAARVAVGAVCKHLLNQFGITLSGYVAAIGGVTASVENIPISQRANLAEFSMVRCPDHEAGEAMQKLIQQVTRQKDTLGGIIEIVVDNLPAGLGSHVHWDRRLETLIGGAVLSVPAVKGVEIGPAFENSSLPGTKVHDPIRILDGVLYRPTNRSGGIEGGISTGQPIIIRAAMKPIATTLNPQPSVDLSTGLEVETHYERSDFCPVPRAVPVLEGVVAFILASALLEKLGGDTIAEMQDRFSRLRQLRLQDMPISGEETVFWSER